MIPHVPKVLLAKRPEDPENPSQEETLVGHTCAVIRAADAILEVLGDSPGRTFGLSSDEEGFLRQCVRRAALLHDLGKANHQFQDLMRGDNQRQALRHECLSAWLALCNKELDYWLFGGEKRLRDVVLCAVLGHHLKVRESGSLEPREASGDTRLLCFWAHASFIECLEKGAALLNLPGSVPLLRDTEIDLTDRPLGELRKWLLEDLDEPRIVPFVKALLMAADLAGSALPSRADLKIKDWIPATLGRRCSEDELHGIVVQRLQSNSPREFQCRVKDTGYRVTLVRAGCGSGKTVAAYMWAAKQARERKLFLCYPTTGTATEGYRDYIVTSDMLHKSALVHSRSELDIRRILGGEEQSLEEDSESTIPALISWDVPMTVCTADTVLGIIQNSRRSLYAFPAMINAAFVFDEIHQYDRRLWGALLRFITAFKGAPMLLMTASLPKERRSDLEKILSKNFAHFEGPADHENIPRYKLSCADSHPWSKVENVLDEGGKVLWVCNTVSQCVQTGQEVEKKLHGVRVLPYHSRYRYRDRLQRHQEVIEAFRGCDPIVAVTTQVCEVSLDLSADLLVTDLAPIPALIQRLGRLNRRATAGSPPRDAIVLKPLQATPYDDDDLKCASQWLQELAGKPVSQRVLAEAFEKMTSHGGNESLIKSEWLDGKKLTGQSPLREAGFTIPIVREEDLKKAGGAVSYSFVLEREIPMLLDPVRTEITKWGRMRHAWIAPKGRVVYDEKWGGTWARR